MATFDKIKGISVASGFKLQAEAPLDGRFVVDTITDRDALVTEHGAYEGMAVYVKANKTTYRLKGTTNSNWEVDGAKYTHPNTEREDTTSTQTASHGGTVDVIASVTSDDQGHVTGVDTKTVTFPTAPTNVATADKLKTPRTITIAGAVTGTATEFDGSKNISINTTKVDAAKVQGVLDVSCIPPSALERVKVVTDEAARLKLTASDVQKGDTVKVQATNKMYFVVDDTQLGSEDGYEEYTVGAAASVPWTGVTGKPAKFEPTDHTHDIDDVTGLRDAIDAKQDAADALELGTTSTTAYQGDLGKKAYDHSQTKHAPSDAEKNVIVGVQKNGDDITPDTSSRKVNIEVPTKTSELTNDSNYVIVSVGASSPAGAPKNSLWFKTEA